MSNSALIAHLREHAVRVEPGGFVLKSGKRSDWFIDAKQTTCRPEGMVLVADAALDVIPDDATAIGGLTMGADAVAFGVAAVAATRNRALRSFSVRKEEKDHGGGGRIAGALEAGDRVVIAEDASGSRVFQLVARSGRLCWHRFGKGEDVIAGDRIRPGAWQHVAATFDGTAHRLYVDGALQGEAPGPLRFDPDLHVRIGMKGSGEFPFKGLIDDVRIYSRALSAEEVKALVEGRSGPVPPTEPEEPMKLSLIQI